MLAVSRVVQTVAYLADLTVFVKAVQLDESLVDKSVAKSVVHRAAKSVFQMVAD